MSGDLTEDQQSQSVFSDQLFEAIKSGKITKEKFRSAMAELLSSVEIHNYKSSLNLFQDGEDPFPLEVSERDGSGRPT